MHYVPVRTCIACRRSGDKSAFLRIVKTKDGKIFLDTTGKADGRGAYVCNDENCINKVVDKKLLSKVFSCSAEADVYRKLTEDYANTKS